MELTMLGTGNANVTEYFNTCFLLEEAGQYFLVDTGGGNGILKALKNAGVSVMDIHDIFITHEHLDHLLGLFWIIRTAGVNTPAEKFVAEMAVLRKNFEDILDMSEKVSAPSLLKGKTNPLFDYIARHRNSLRKIIVNARTVQEEITRRFGDDLLIGIVPGPFDDFGLEEAIGEALQKEVRLKSGGRIFIEETKACVAIDVDSGEDRGSGNLGRLNAEAAYEIARQIKLRNLSGKIIIDFAGLPEIRYLNSTIEILEQELRNDYVKNTVFGLSRAGCVEIVRMRRRPSLRDLLTTECTCCQGTGRVEK